MNLKLTMIVLREKAIGTSRMSKQSAFSLGTSETNQGLKLQINCRVTERKYLELEVASGCISCRYLFHGSIPWTQH